MKKIEVIESFTLGKRYDQTKNEDGLILTENFVGVIDGVSAWTAFEIDGKTTGGFIKWAIQEAFKTMPKEVDLIKCIKYLNKFIKEQYKTFGVLDEIKNDVYKTPGACLLVYSAYRNEIWLVGDGTGKVGKHTIQNPLLVDKENIKIRKVLIDRYLSTGSTVEELIEEDYPTLSLKPLYLQQIKYRNVDMNGSPYNFSVIDGINVPPNRLMKVYKLQPTDKTVILTTNGYPKAKKTLAESEKYLEYVKNKDPLCINIFKAVRPFPPGLHSYDDRAYVRFNVVG